MEIQRSLRFRSSSELHPDREIHLAMNAQPDEGRIQKKNKSVPDVPPVACFRPWRRRELPGLVVRPDPEVGEVLSSETVGTSDFLDRHFRPSPRAQGHRRIDPRPAIILRQAIALHASSRLVLLLLLLPPPPLSCLLLALLQSRYLGYEYEVLPIKLVFRRRQ